MHLEKFNYNIPESLIALTPKTPRDKSKIVVVDKNLKLFDFEKIVDLLEPKDALVFNETKVIGANLEGFIGKSKVSVNLNRLIKRQNGVTWSALIKSNKKVKKNQLISFSKNFFAKIIKSKILSDSKFFFLYFNYNYQTFRRKLSTFGKTPLPPYIKKKRKIKTSDIKSYQTIFARKEGAVAAPTASLHFTNKLLEKIQKKKIKIIKVTLHVSAGTFLPIRKKNIHDHKMHYEFGHITKKASIEINKTKRNGGRVIAVGTTVLRLLESSKNELGFVKPFKGETNIFIKPGWKIETIDGLITNFHTPRSSLIILVVSILGEIKTQNLYEYAVKKKLRFYSYGDACLIWKKNE